MESRRYFWAAKISALAILVGCAPVHSDPDLNFNCQEVSGIVNGIRCENAEAVCYGRSNEIKVLSCFKK